MLFHSVKQYLIDLSNTHQSVNMVEIEAQLSLTMEFDIDIGSVEYLFKIMTDIGHSSGYFEIVKN